MKWFSVVMTEGKYTGAGGLQRGRAVTCQEFPGEATESLGYTVPVQRQHGGVFIGVIVEHCYTGW